jgi:hypothetical protein
VFKVFSNPSNVALLNGLGKEVVEVLVRRVGVVVVQVILDILDVPPQIVKVQIRGADDFEV